MATNFPTSLDTFSNPAGTDLLSSGHATQHVNANDAIEALEAKIGTDSTAATLPAGAVIGKGSGVGIKVDTGAPTYGWRDLIGDITPKSVGAGAPTLDAFRGGNVRSFRYSVGDDGDAIFHIPHDYVPGTDLYLHLHWGHNGTNISGSLVVTFYVTYAKGHQQANFPAEVSPVLTVGSLSISNTPQYRHRVDEIQLSATSPTATQLDSDDIEVDGLILVHYDTTTIPTITAGSGEPFYFTLDIHYQSTSMGTKSKTGPTFYT